MHDSRCAQKKLLFPFSGARARSGALLLGAFLISILFRWPRSSTVSATVTIGNFLPPCCTSWLINTSNERAALNGQGKLCKNFFKSFRVLWLNASDWPIRSAGLWPLCHSHQFSCFNGSCTSDSPHSIGDALLVPLRKLFLVFSSFSTFNIRLSRFRDGNGLVRLSRLRISNRKFLVEPLYSILKIPPTSKLEALNCIKETWNIFTKFRTI